MALLDASKQRMGARRMVGMVIEDVAQNRIRVQEGKARHLASQTFTHLVCDGPGKGLVLFLGRPSGRVAILP